MGKAAGIYSVAHMRTAVDVNIFVKLRILVYVAAVVSRSQSSKSRLVDRLPREGSGYPVQSSTDVHTGTAGGKRDPVGATSWLGMPAPSESGLSGLWTLTTMMRLIRR